MADPTSFRASRLKLRLLQAALASAGPVTVQDGMDTEQLAAPFEDGGRWVGRAVRDLAGIIQPVTDAAGRPAAVRSARRSRNAGYVLAWRLADRKAAEQQAAALLNLLAKAPAQPKQQLLF